MARRHALSSTALDALTVHAAARLSEGITAERAVLPRYLERRLQAPSQRAGIATCNPADGCAATLPPQHRPLTDVCLFKPRGDLLIDVGGVRVASTPYTQITRSLGADRDGRGRGTAR